MTKPIHFPTPSLWWGTAIALTYLAFNTGYQLLTPRTNGDPMDALTVAIITGSVAIFTAIFTLIGTIWRDTKATKQAATTIADSNSHTNETVNRIKEDTQHVTHITTNTTETNGVVTKTIVPQLDRMERDLQPSITGIATLIRDLDIRNAIKTKASESTGDPAYLHGAIDAIYDENIALREANRDLRQQNGLLAAENTQLRQQLHNLNPTPTTTPHRQPPTPRLKPYTP